MSDNNDFVNVHGNRVLVSLKGKGSNWYDSLALAKRLITESAHADALFPLSKGRARWIKKEIDRQVPSTKNTLRKLRKMLIEREVFIKNSHPQVSNRFGICVDVRTNLHERGSFEIILEKGFQADFVPENISEYSIEGPMNGLAGGRRTIILLMDITVQKIPFNVMAGRSVSNILVEDCQETLTSVSNVKINGSIVSLDTIVKNGDELEYTRPCCDAGLCSH